jgi:hypothetical protein
VARAAKDSADTCLVTINAQNGFEVLHPFLFGLDHLKSKK